MKLFTILVVVMVVILGISSVFIKKEDHTADAVSIWIQNSMDDFLNGTSDNVTIIGTGTDSALILDFTEDTHSHWVNISPPSSPSIRGHHTMAGIHGTDKLVLFGGWSNFVMNNETWVYDIINNTWTQRFPLISPSPREDHAMASVYNDDKAIIFGGGTTINNETWVYDLSNNSWEKMMPAVSPRARGDHEMVNIWGTNKVMLFGGGFSIDNSTWIFDLSNETWTNMSPPGKSPTARHDHTMVAVYGTDKVVLFGGQTMLELSNETWIYDHSENSWTEMVLTYKPKARWLHAMAPIWGTDKVVMFGGGIELEYGHFNDTWVYNLGNNTWKEFNLSIKPIKRWDHKLASVHGTGDVILFGGTGDLNDTWKFTHLRFMNNGTYISIPFDTGTNCSLISICWNASITKYTSIEFQIRTADTKLGLNSKTFIGPAGSPASYYSTSPSIIWPGHGNESWVQYKAYFHTRNYDITPQLLNVSIIYNYWPETTLVYPINSSISAINRPLFRWDFSDQDSANQQAFQVLIDDDIEFTSIDFDNGKQNSINDTWQFPNETTYNELPDGRWYWKVRTKDIDGSWGLFCTPWNFKIDTQLPSSKIRFPKNNHTYNEVLNIIGSAQDDINGSGIKDVKISIKNVNDDLYWNGINWIFNETWLKVTGTTDWSYDSISIPWTSGNRYEITSQVFDIASNIETPKKGIVFIFDSEEVEFSNPIPKGSEVSKIENVTVGITISDSIAGVNASTIEYSLSDDYGKSWSNWFGIYELENDQSIAVSINLTLPNGTVYIILGGANNV